MRGVNCSPVIQAQEYLGHAINLANSYKEGLSAKFVCIRQIQILFLFDFSDANRQKSFILYNIGDHTNVREVRENENCTFRGTGSSGQHD